MKCVIAYELALGIICIALIMCIVTDNAPDWLNVMESTVLCGLVGGAGGVTYCLRAVYLNKCVHKKWDPEWHTWYYIRPLVSIICGLVSWVFLKSGLLILESDQRPEAAQYAYYALAFIAGLNVDKFVGKLEDIALTVWGIEKSRSHRETHNNKG